MMKIPHGQHVGRCWHTVCLRLCKHVLFLKLCAQAPVLLYASMHCNATAASSVLVMCAHLNAAADLAPYDLLKPGHFEQSLDRQPAGLHAVVTCPWLDGHIQPCWLAVVSGPCCPRMLPRMSQQRQSAASQPQQPSHLNVCGTDGQYRRALQQKKGCAAAGPHAGQ